jgi:hypothetical protein
LALAQALSEKYKIGRSIPGSVWAFFEDRDATGEKDVGEMLVKSSLGLLAFNK